jgi:hypothetical protein
VYQHNTTFLLHLQPSTWFCPYSKKISTLFFSSWLKNIYYTIYYYCYSTFTIVYHMACWFFSHELESSHYLKFTTFLYIAYQLLVIHSYGNDLLVLIAAYRVFCIFNINYSLRLISGV